MARISNDRMRQLIIDGGMTRSQKRNPRRKPSNNSNPLINQSVVDDYLKARSGRKNSSNSAENQQQQIDRQTTVAPKPVKPKPAEVSAPNPYNMDAVNGRESEADRFRDKMNSMTPKPSHNGNKTIDSDRMRNLITPGSISRSQQNNFPATPIEKERAQQPIVPPEKLIPVVSRSNEPIITQKDIENYQQSLVDRPIKDNQNPVNQQTTNNQPSPSTPTGQSNNQAPSLEVEEYGFPSYEQIKELSNQFNRDLENDRINNAKYADEFMNQPMEGLTPDERRAYQEEFDINNNRELQKYLRMINAEMGSRGIQGGAAQYPKTDVIRASIEAGQQFQRDLTAMNAEKRRENLIAKLAIQEGLTGQNLLSRQQAFDYLSAKDAVKQEKKWLDRFFKDYYGKSDSIDKNEVLDKWLSGSKDKEVKKKKKKKTNKAGSRI